MLLLALSAMPLLVGIVKEKNMTDLVGMKFNMPEFKPTGEVEILETEVTASFDGSDLTGDIITINKGGKNVDVSLEKFVQTVINCCEKYGEDKILV